jgi:hypothetical protein
MGNLVTFMEYLSGNAGRDASVTSQRLHAKEKDFFRDMVCFLMRSRLLLLGKPNNKAYAFRSIPQRS